MSTPATSLRGNTSTASAIATGLFVLAALTVGGGALGLTVGVLSDKAVNHDAHGFPGLFGLLVGTPVGALLGLVLGLLLLKRQSFSQRFRTGALALAVAAACALGLFGAVQLELMRW
ncbi:hypothetical protein [Pyxidicoccus caerfyrddinensis]|uniref:hypothetical protein n=1 Tax=Pyxidicoccus caerfyrddinensis TaxID=2709663 RepID=UPI0013DD1C59|nr:hypothetical protein [Pyxidicoccus caerfyrddinensis]